MFALSFALFLLIAINVNGQTNDINGLRPNDFEKGYPFGKLRLSDAGKNEELIISGSESEKSQLNQDQLPGIQPLPSPCTGVRPLTKIFYPKDKTKYFQCRDEFHYEIFTCPNGGQFNEQTNSCDTFIPVSNKCEQEKPCLNDGQCTVLSDSSFKCTCRQDWTGERCETALNSCVKKPCGLNAECRTLKTSDYEQDYVCICNARTSYGLNCQETVPNPCLINSEQFFPFAFGQHAYIQCDGELVHFQPCGSVLYWNQEQKICDRKRSKNVASPIFVTKLISTNKNDDQQEQIKININEELSSTTSQTEQQKENEGVLAFVPARVANRQQLQSNFQNEQLSNMNNQKFVLSQNSREKEQQTQESSDQFLSSQDSNQNRQDFNVKVKPWPNQQFRFDNQQIEATKGQPLTIQSGQNQQWSSITQQQRPSTLIDSSSIDQSQRTQSQSRQDNQQQQFNLPQEKQVFGTQSWLNQVPEIKTQTNQRFVAQPQLSQGFQTSQNQLSLPDQNQQTSIETTTEASNVFHLQGFRNQNSREQENSWQNKPNIQLTGNQFPQTVDLKTQNTQNFISQPQLSQGSNLFQNQQQLAAGVPEVTDLDNKNRLNTGIQRNNQQRQNTGNNQLQSSLTVPSEGSLIDIQQVRVDTQIPSSSQTVVNQPWTPKVQSESSVDLTVGQSQKGTLSQFRQDNQQQNFPQQKQVFGAQPWLNQATDIKTQTNQRFVAQPQPWQGTQSILNQGRSEGQNQQTLTNNFIETTTAEQKAFHLQGFANQNSRDHEQSWQNTQQIQTQPIKPKFNPMFGFQLKLWPVETSTKQNQQTNTLTVQSWSQNKNQQPLIAESSSPIQNNQQFRTQDQKLTGSEDVQMQTSQNFAARPGLQSFQNQPWSQNGQLTGNTFETTTIANKDIQQGFSMQNLRGWQPSQTGEQRSQDNNQIQQQTTTEQRKTLDSMPTLVVESWKPRSY